VNDRLVLHIECIDHAMIQLELRVVLGANIMSMKCRVLGGKTGPIAMVQVFV
jgi:hypothetical protein